MRTLIAAAVLGMLAFGGAYAGQAQSTPQQEKMKSCNAEAKEKALKGDERKSFMKDCLKKDAAKADDGASEKQKAQREKMKSCNKEAKEKALKGDERKQFMSTCLKG